MKTISKIIDRIIDWCWHHAEFAKSLIVVWHFAGAALFWTLFDHKVGIPVLVFSWTMLVLGQLWYALPARPGSKERVIYTGVDMAKPNTQSHSIPSVVMALEEFRKLSDELDFYQWVRAKYGIVKISEDPAIDRGSFDWAELKIMYDACAEKPVRFNPEAPKFHPNT